MYFPPQGIKHAICAFCQACTCKPLIHTQMMTDCWTYSCSYMDITCPLFCYTYLLPQTFLIEFLHSYNIHIKYMYKIMLYNRVVPTANRTIVLVSKNWKYVTLTICMNPMWSEEQHNPHHQPGPVHTAGVLVP